MKKLAPCGKISHIHFADYSWQGITAGEPDGTFTESEEGKALFLLETHFSGRIHAPGKREKKYERNTKEN